ncbi:MAG: RNA methyltransferase PUA domain-containing protein [Gammaproteobacteria bacterium]
MRRRRRWASRHLVRVLRLTLGAKLIVFDGGGSDQRFP